MIEIILTEQGLGLPLALHIAHQANTRPKDSFMVMSPKLKGAEHLVRALPNVSFVISGPRSMAHTARKIASSERRSVVLVYGSPEMANVAFSDGFVGMSSYRFSGTTSAELHHEVAALEVDRIDTLITENLAQFGLVEEAVPRRNRYKIREVPLLGDWLVREPHPISLDRIHAGRPLLWAGTLDQIGTGYRDFARVFGLIDNEWTPIVVLSGEASPVEFEDLCANLSRSGALERATILTTPPLGLLNGLVAQSARANGALVTTSLLLEPNPLLPLAASYGLPVIGYANECLRQHAQHPIEECDQGELLSLAEMITGLRAEQGV